MQLEHQERAEQELVNGRKRKIEETPSFFSWFWQSGEIPEGSDPVSDLIKDELWTNPMSGSADNVQVYMIAKACTKCCSLSVYPGFDPDRRFLCVCHVCIGHSCLCHAATQGMQTVFCKACGLHLPCVPLQPACTVSCWLYNRTSQPCESSFHVKQCQ